MKKYVQFILFFYFIILIYQNEIICVKKNEVKSISHFREINEINNLCKLTIDTINNQVQINSFMLNLQSKNNALLILRKCLSKNSGSNDKFDKQLDNILSQELICICLEKEKLNINDVIEAFAHKENENIHKLSKSNEDKNKIKSKQIQPKISEKTVSLLSLNNKLKNKFSDENIDIALFNNDKKHYNLKFTQSKIRLIDSVLLDNPSDTDGKIEKRFIRMIWVSAIVLVLSFYCFLFMKTAIDCASNSKSALNKMKETQSREINEKLQTENIIRNNPVENSD